MNSSWIAGKYEINGKPCEINTSYSTFAYGEFFAQGESADDIIAEIYKYWVNGNTTQEQAVAGWINSNIY